MSGEIHPQVSAVLRQAQQLQAVMDDQLHKMSTASFAATDEANTVEVTLDGHHRLTSVFIEDGLLRLGTETVSSRLNEALRKATAAASAAIEVDRERLNQLIAALTNDNRY